MINKEDMDKLSGALLDILNAELAAGNSVCETWHGNYPYEGATAVVLKKPFLTPVRRDLPNIVFDHTNDPHYWKADYYDKQTGLMLICRFTSPEDLKIVF